MCASLPTGRVVARPRNGRPPWGMNDPQPALRLADPGAPVLDTTIGDELRAAADRAPDAVALIDGTADPATCRSMDLCGIARPSGAVRGGARRSLRTENRGRAVGADVAGGLMVSYAVGDGRLGAGARESGDCGRREVAHVLGQSGAEGVVLVDTGVTTTCAPTLGLARPQLPALRTVRSRWTSVGELSPAVGTSRFTPRGGRNRRRATSCTRREPRARRRARGSRTAA